MYWINEKILNVSCFSAIFLLLITLQIAYLQVYFFIFKNIERFREAKSNIEIKPQTGYVYFSSFHLFRASFPCFDGYDVSNNIIYNVNIKSSTTNFYFLPLFYDIIRLYIVLSIFFVSLTFFRVPYDLLLQSKRKQQKEKWQCTFSLLEK